MPFSAVSDHVKEKLVALLEGSSQTERLILSLLYREALCAVDVAAVLSVEVSTIHELSASVQRYLQAA